jgi:molybdenum cofactor synthesis domain-containing protein
MKPFGELISLEEAKQIIDRHITKLERTESIPIDQALGRVSAENIVASVYTPSFDRASVDGYAVKAEDTFGATPSTPKSLKLIDWVYAGSLPKKELSNGECIQMCTGAPMPVGANGVVMVEDTIRNGTVITIAKSISPQSGIGFKGEDIKKGERIIETGQLLNPGKIGVLASQGLSRVRVYEKPIVAVLPTGKEVVAIGERLKLGQLYDINSHTLSAVVKENGGLPLAMKITNDSIEGIKSSIKSALTADIIVTSGGSSMGEKDLIINVLEEWGEVLFHGIKIKPGKPTTFAVVKNKPVLGMPGYPTSCLINAYLLLGPVIRKMGHMPQKPNSNIQAKLGERITGGKDRMRFQTVRFIDGRAYPINKESGAITGTAYADGYVIVPVDAAIEKETEVSVTLF